MKLDYFKSGINQTTLDLTFKNTCPKLNQNKNSSFSLSWVGWGDAKPPPRYYTYFFDLGNNWGGEKTPAGKNVKMLI